MEVQSSLSVDSPASAAIPNDGKPNAQEVLQLSVVT